MDINIKKYDWIDAMRGYAILGVIMIHTSQLPFGNSFHLQPITRIGDLGVMMFFIASSYTLFNSYKNRLNSDGKNTTLFFFIRRFFRISPLYYLAGIFYLTLTIFYDPLWSPPPPINIIKVIANFTFLNGIYLPAINYIPPGGWSVGVEMIFYLTIPFLFSKIKNIHTALLFLSISLFSSFVIQMLLHFLITYYTHYSWTSLRGGNLYFWFPNQFPVFCFGIVLFFLNQFNIKQKYSQCILVLSLLLIVLLSLVNYEITFPKFLIQREYLYAVAFCLFGFSLSKTNFQFIIKPINKLGKVSFSAYLSHFIIIELVWKVFCLFFKDGINGDINFIIIFIVVVIVTYFFSKITYKIERFGILIGESLIEKIKNKP